MIPSRLSVDRRKAEERRKLKAQIAALGAGYNESASNEIAQRLLSLPQWRQAKTVFCYAGTKTEIDTRPILAAALAQGKTLAVPLCTGRGVMQAKIIHSLSELHSGAYGIMEPPKSAQKLLPQQIDLCIIPCLSASPDGTRLGYGGGYYDRFLPEAQNAVRIVLCREVLVRQVLPRDVHDVRADFLLTEHQITACR